MSSFLMTHPHIKGPFVRR